MQASSQAAAAIKKTPRLLTLRKQKMKSKSARHRATRNRSWNSSPKKPEKNGTKLVPIGNTYLAPLRLFSNKHKTLSDLPDGASIAIPNDPSNGGRALLLLEKNGLLKLKEGVNPVKAVVSDIASNPKNLKIIELEAPQLPRALEDCDASIINGGYAVSAGLDPKTALAQEDNTSPYVNVIAAREHDKDNPTYQKFVKIFQTEATRKYINDNFQATLTPGF